MSQVQPPAPASPVPSGPPAARPSNPEKTRFIIIWVIVAVMFLGAAASAVGSLQRTVYGARGTVSEYFDALQRKDAAAALQIPGVTLSSGDLKGAGLPENSSSALLRGSVMPDVSDVSFVSDEAGGDGIRRVTFEYTLGENEGSTTFELKKQGGFFSGWAFATSPLAAVNLSVNHTTLFSMNGADFDVRQVAPKKTKPAFENIVNVLVFTPGEYTYTVDTDLLTAEETTVFADTPGNVEEAAVDAEPTDEFIEEAQKQFNAQLDECATQKVLQPTGCPFGFTIQDRVSGDPAWEITEYPEITLEPGTNSWEIPNSAATATLKVDVQDLADGSISSVTERVPFKAFGNVYLFADGTVTAQVLTKDSGSDE